MERTTIRRLRNVGSEPPDAQVLADSIGDPEQFRTVWMRHHDAVHAFVAARVGPDAADDIVSTTFLAAFRFRARYKADHTRSDACAWLLGIASNELRQHWRVEQRWLEAQKRLPDSATVDGDERAGGVDPFIASALQDLSRRLREPFLLRVVADLTYEQISLALDLPLGTVRSRINRARKQLAAHLERNST